MNRDGAFFLHGYDSVKLKTVFLSCPYQAPFQCWFCVILAELLMQIKVLIKTQKRVGLIQD
jgi:hypothetical protein